MFPRFGRVGTLGFVIALGDSSMRFDGEDLSLPDTKDLNLLSLFLIRGSAHRKLTMDLSDITDKGPDVVDNTPNYIRKNSLYKCLKGLEYYTKGITTWLDWPFFLYRLLYIPQILVNLIRDMFNPDSFLWKLFLLFITYVDFSHRFLKLKRIIEWTIAR